MSVLKVESMKPRATEKKNIRTRTPNMVKAPMSVVCMNINASTVSTASAGSAFVSAAIAMPTM